MDKFANMDTPPTIDEVMLAANIVFRMSVRDGKLADEFNALASNSTPECRKYLVSMASAYDYRDNQLCLAGEYIEDYRLELLKGI